MRARLKALLATSVLCAVLVVTPLPSSAGPAGPSSRTVVEEYAGPAPGFYAGNQGSYVFVPDCANRLGCVTLTPEPGDRFMRVTVKDAAAPNPQYWVELLASGSSYGYCGGPSDVIPITGETEIWLLLPQGTCEDGTPAAATRGEFTIELASSRKALGAGGAAR